MRLKNQKVDIIWNKIKYYFMAESLKTKFLTGISWTTASHVILMVLGVVQLSITSRLLTPVDFGIYAIATFFSSLGNVAFSMGLSAALIQKRGDIKSYLNTSWAAGILVAIVVSAIIMALIPFVCKSYYHNADAIWPSLVIMLNCLFVTASNPALIIYRKEINLKKIFYLDVFSKLFSFILVVVSVYFLRSYWGLIIAILSESIFRLVYSYFLHPYKPRFEIKWDQFKEMYSFSGWIQLKNIASWLSSSIDTAIVGNVLGTKKLGFYNRAQSVSNYPPTFINAVIDTVAFPLYSQINDDKERTNRIVISVQNTMILLMSLISIVFIRYSDKVIQIILGNQWTSMSNVFAVLGIAYLLQALLLSFNPVLRALGFTRQEFIFYIIKIGLTVALLYPFVNKWDLMGAAWAINASVIISFPIMIFIIKKKTGLHLRDYYYSILIAVLSVVATHYLVNIISAWFQNGWLWLIEMVIALLTICGIQLITYIITKKGPGEALYQLIKIRISH